MIGYGDHHRVDGFLRQHFAMRRVDSGAVRPAFDPRDGACEPAFIGIAEAHDFGARILLERVHQFLAARACADHAHGDAVVGRGPRGGRGGEQGSSLQ